MKHLISVTIFLVGVSFAAITAVHATADQCLDPCFTTNNSCQKDCTMGLHKERTACGSNVGCVDTVDLNFAQCQTACTDIAKTCVTGCMTKPAAAATPKPSN